MITKQLQFRGKMTNKIKFAIKRYKGKLSHSVQRNEIEGLTAS